MSAALKRLSALTSQLLWRDTPEWPDSRIHIHQLTPTLFLPRAAEIEPDALAIHHLASDGNIVQRDYKATASRAKGLAYYLKSKGLKRVGILAPNTPAFLEAIFGIAAAGAVNVAVNYRLSPEDIAFIFDHAEVDSIIVDAELVPLLDTFVKTHPGLDIIVDMDTSDATAGPYNKAIGYGLDVDEQRGSSGWAGLDHEAIDEDFLIALAYTSGTTSRPKGVEYTHRGAYLAALANVIESGLNYSDGRRAKYLCTLPSFHAMGWTFPWAVTAVRGTHYCLRKIDYPLIWRLLKSEGITHFNAAPTVNTLLCSDINAARLSSPIRVTVAASPPSPYLFERMESLNLMPIHAYGLTETYGPVAQSYRLESWASLSPQTRFAKMARQGHGFLTSLPIRVIKTGLDSDQIQDVQSDGVEIGEIVFTGNICARGYHNDWAATKKLFAGGVLHSGDLAVRHADGAFQIMDRAKDLIISGGENISSVALESIMMTHPNILEVACVAVADDQWGERPKAFVTLKPDGTDNRNTTGEEILAWTKRHVSISRFAVPREVEIVSELPKTSTGKVQKNKLRERAKAAIT